MRRRNGKDTNTEGVSDIDSINDTKSLFHRNKFGLKVDLDENVQNLNEA
jgi:hypothetical protein